MNICVVVEGVSSESKVYPEWIRYFNPRLRQVHSITHLSQDSYFLVSGHGYPNYMRTVRNAIADLNSFELLDRLVIAVDSEEMTVAEKTAELKGLVESVGTCKEVRYVIQRQCLESWCLGNRKIVQRNPQDPTLRKYLEHYDVMQLDPANMPSASSELSGSQFAFKYLSRVMQARGIHYSKRDPRYVMDHRYLFHLLKRATDTAHIATILDLQAAFVSQ